MPDTDLQDDRPMGRSIRRGLLGRCPNCGKGHLLQGYLKVRPACPVCGENMAHHRADDGPAYLTILIVGHLTAPSILFAFVHWRPSPVTLLSIFATATVALSLTLLPRLKGMLVAIQWSRRMHGFATGEAENAQ